MTAKTSTHRWRWIAVALLASVLGIITVFALLSDTEATDSTNGSVSEGRIAFNAVCAECHGEDATGTDDGPPLVHEIYRPNHHSNQAFVLAVRRGSPQHHWRFGSMPAQTEVGEDELLDIISYIRKLQQDAGIE